MEKSKIYLAGPEVFYPNAIAIGEKHKEFCNANGYIGLYPLDNCIKRKTPDETAQAIVEANIKMIQECDFVLANLSDFRGSPENPACDSGTAWECGYALAIGKKVIAYTNNNNSIPREIVNHLDLAIVSREFGKLFFYLDTVIFKTSHDTITNAILPLILNLDPVSPDIQDANAVSAFMLGYRYGKKVSCSATLTDRRTQIEKYGKFDKNGNSVENFGHSTNIMISCTTKIVSPNDNF